MWERDNKIFFLSCAGVKVMKPLFQRCQVSFWLLLQVSPMVTPFEPAFILPYYDNLFLISPAFRWCLPGLVL
jgi:hypothetical protein